MFWLRLSVVSKLGSASGGRTVTTRVSVSYNEAMIAKGVGLAALIVAFAAGLTACGGSKKLATVVTTPAAVVNTPAASRPRRVVFGVGGGNMIPFRIALEPNGRVRHSGPTRPRRRHLSRAEIVSLWHLVRLDFRDGLESRLCSGTNPDVGSRFIRGRGRTITVHGSCEPRFTKLWNTLARAVGLSG
jgi:hypothetical protein